MNINFFRLLGALMLDVTAVPAYCAAPAAGINGTPALALNVQGVPAKPADQKKAISFMPPSADSIPNDDFGKMVKKGEQIFINTQQNARQYVGNSLNCVNCHLDEVARQMPVRYGALIFLIQPIVARMSM